MASATVRNGRVMKQIFNNSIEGPKEGWIDLGPYVPVKHEYFSDCCGRADSFFVQYDICGKCRNHCSYVDANGNPKP